MTASLLLWCSVSNVQQKSDLVLEDLEQEEEEQKEAEKDVKEESGRVSLTLSRHYTTSALWLYWWSLISTDGINT